MTLWTIHHENDFFLTFFLSLSLILSFFLSVFSPFLSFFSFFAFFLSLPVPFLGHYFFALLPSSQFFLLTFISVFLSLSFFFETIIKTSRKKFLLLFSGFPSLQHCCEIWIRDRNRVSLSFLFFSFSLSEKGRIESELKRDREE